MKDHIPGYTGYIPRKFETFGITSGEVNKQLVLCKKLQEKVKTERTYYSHSSTRLNKDKDILKYGYKSRYANNWLGGTTFKENPQHIPCIVKI